MGFALISREIYLYFFRPAADEVNYSRTEFLFMRTGLYRSERNIDVVVNIPDTRSTRSFVYEEALRFFKFVLGED